MPAAAVIPAPIAYIKAVAVKKLVVGSREGACGPPRVVTARARPTMSVCVLAMFLAERLGWPTSLL